MSAYKSDFLNVLATRGFIHQMSEPEALDARARTSTITGYIGFDCTASSLHVGSLLQIMMLYWMQQTGHRPIALMGGGTTRVGDPSGKDESRKVLSDQDITDNLKGIRSIFSKFLRFEEANPTSEKFQAVIEGRMTVADVARQFNAKPRTFRQWVNCFRKEGLAGLRKRASWPGSSKL